MKNAFLLVLTLSALALGACGVDTEPYDVVETRDVASPRTFPPGTPDTAERFGFRRPAANPHGGGSGSAPAGPAGYAWDLPEGWKELPPKQFRQGNWLAGGDPEVEAWLTYGTGGSVLDNINRWRGQMGLAPTTPADLGKLPTVPVLGGPAMFVDLPAEGKRMLGIIARDAAGGLVFVKMVGPAKKVEAAQGAFLALARSLRAKSAGHGGMPAGHPSTGNTTSAGLKYVVPSGWRKGDDRQMREVTLHPGAGTDTECYVTVLSAQAGNVAMNVNMWRNQMSQEPLDAATVKALPAIEVLGHPAQWVEIEGTYKGKSAMGGGLESKKDYRMLALICATPRATITVKMVGPSKTVAAEKEKFLAFCRALHL